MLPRRRLLYYAVAGTESAHVADVLQAGYVLHDRLLKPAMVTVAAGPAQAAADGAQ